MIHHSAYYAILLRRIQDTIGALHATSLRLAAAFATAGDSTVVVTVLNVQTSAQFVAPRHPTVALNGVRDATMLTCAATAGVWRASQRCPQELPQRMRHMKSVRLLPLALALALTLTLAAHDATRDAISHVSPASLLGAACHAHILTQPHAHPAACSPVLARSD